MEGMLGRLSIFVVTACILTGAACAESFSFQRNPNLVNSKGHAGLRTFEFDTVSHAITGDLGRGFSNAEHRSPIQPTGRELHMDAAPRGTLLPSENRQLNFGFYRKSQFRPKSTADLVRRTLFQHRPKGWRGRRELAAANAR